MESVALDGTKRHVLATDRVVQPVALAVQGAHVYWADQVGSFSLIIVQYQFTG